MSGGIWQRAVVDLILAKPTCEVTNIYADRTRPVFVPFVFNQSLKCSLIICEPRHMDKYGAVCKTREAKCLYITSAKQLKHVQPGEQAVEFFD